MNFSNFQKKITLKTFAYFASPFIIFLLAIWLIPFPVEKLTPPLSTIILDQNGEILRVYLSREEMWQMPVADEDISPKLKMAVLAYEDKHFHWHPGFNPFSIMRAIIADIRAGEIVQGASTITMQVARMMDRKPRTFTNKFIEIFRALQLEFRYSKEEILTIYFNLAPYGGNIVGVGAASYLYFNKQVGYLSLGEAALLTAIPNSPNLLRPDHYVESAQIARQKVLNILVQQKKISKSQMDEALSESIPDKRFTLPFKIPHLATMLTQSYSSIPVIQSTINVRIQQLAENALVSNLTPLRNKGITNGAIVVIENKTQAVRALVGSYNFFDDKNEGQVNGAIASRSPGSTIKPFVYALGIEHGLISPQSMLYDIPVEYSGYRPINYDGLYHGVVTVEDALIRSLNVPAVNLYAQLGEDGIYSFLKDADVSTITQGKDYYGLSLILGGCGITLLDLTNLYSGLANSGSFRPYRLVDSDPIEEGKILLNEGTCYIISEILSQLRRPELPSVWQYAVEMPKIAWKTGTSYGHRDAWSIGYTPRYTIGVWVGNFDSKGIPELVGAEVAAPILFALFNSLEKKSDNRWFVQPSNVDVRQVCAISGMPLSKNCASTKDELYIPGISPNQECSIHQLIWVDKKSGKRLCSHCREGRSYTEKIVEQWPAEIATWMERNGYPIDKIPEHYSKCPKITSLERPVIKSPIANSEFKIRPGVDLKYQKILLDASVSNQSQNIYWFLDGKMIYSGAPTKKVFITPQQGLHRLICMDEEGRSSEVSFNVR